MSKESKPRDRWQQVYAAAHNRDPLWCKSCGYFPVANNGAHRGDCNAATLPVRKESPE